MPLKRVLTLTNKVGQITRLSVEFDDDEWIVLKAYMAECDRIEKSETLKDFNVNINISGEQGQKIKFQASIPSDDAIAVCIHRMRPFILQDERTHFGRVCNILKKRMNNPVYHEIIDKIRHDFSGKNDQQMMVMKVNDTVLNSHERVLEWLNAEEYHRDTEKKERLDALCSVFPNGIIKAFYCNMLIAMVDAVLNIGRNIHAIEAAEGIPYKVT